MIYLKYLLEATQGVLRYRGKQEEFAAFSHDTRQLVPGEMFVAVWGARGNGHDYVLDALRRGASGLLVEAVMLNALSEETQAVLAKAHVAVVAVEDTRIALQQYAQAILQRWQPIVIAVAGGVGKTSTKEAIATVLASRFKTFRSWQNYNDLLGIPLSLGRLEAEHTHAVLELGSDHPGEIADLCRILQPRIGVLTNCSPMQLQYFGSLERLVGEFGMLLNSLPAGGQLFYNQDDTWLCQLVERHEQSKHALQIYPFGQVFAAPESSTREKHALVSITQSGWDGVQAKIVPLATQETGEIVLAARLLGKHHLNTMLAAYQVGSSQGLASDEITHALLDVVPLAGRLYPLPGLHAARLLDDTHNASPASVIAGLTTLHALTPAGGRRIAVLGDMLNLGDYAENAHLEVGKQAASLVDYLITRGERAALIAEAARQGGLERTHIVTTSTHEDAAQAVRKLLAEGPQQVAESTSYDVVLIKGSEEARMERVTEMLMARSWEAPERLVRQAAGWKKTIFMHADRPTWVEIDLNAIGSNTRHIKASVGPAVRVLVALKADAYGHGALKVARTVLHNGASMLGVATVSEATPLREANITAPILVFGYVPRWQMREAVRLGVRITLYTREAAQELSRTALDLGQIVSVHVKVDTGMGRLGIRYEQMAEILALIHEINALPGLELEGFYTHFAQSDAADKTHVNLQLTRFQNILRELEEEGLRPPIVHAANSAATLALPAAHFDMVRPGIVIYGLEPSADVPLPEGFRAALSFKTQVSQVKWIPAGEGISYGSTYITSEPRRIAVLPVGYADGFRRTPRNWGSVLIHGQAAPILGRVCMDQCMVDVSDIPQTRIGDEVVLIGRQGEAQLSAEQVAERLGTINYEVVSELLARVPRVD